MISKKINGFTLIEVIVSITILSIVMISVFTIFKIANDSNNKIEVSRALQENVKNLVEMFSEEIRTSTITGLTSSMYGSCSLDGEYSQSGTKICLRDNSGNLYNYYIASYDDLTDVYTRVIDLGECGYGNKQCVLVKNTGSDIYPVVNSWVEITDFNLTLLQADDESEKKLVLNFTIQPSSTKGINSNLIKNNKVVFQTTLSQRLYKSY